LHRWHAQYVRVIKNNFRLPAFWACGKYLRWWSHWAAKKQLMALRAGTVANRRKLGLCLWSMKLWDAAVRKDIRAKCEYISGQRELAVEALAMCKLQCCTEVEAKIEGEQGFRSLAEDLHGKITEIASIRAKVFEVEAENSLLLGDMEAQVEIADALKSDLRRLSEDPPGLETEQVLLAARKQRLVEVEDALRFVFLRTKAESDQALQARDPAKAEAAELQCRLDKYRRDCEDDLDGFDRMAAALALEGGEMQKKSLRLQKELAGLSFSVRMRDLELQRFKLPHDDI